MAFLETAQAIEFCKAIGDDRVEVLQDKDRTVIVLADGAGGMGGGGRAADQVVAEVKNAFKEVHSAQHWGRFLGEIDQRIADGETTAVVVDCRPYGTAGASVGDSEAWVINSTEVERLTKNQIRKPLLGSGSAQPVEFTFGPINGHLIVASDGLFNYAKQEQIHHLVMFENFFEIPRKAIELVRLRSNQLQDDVSVVLGRQKPLRATKKRYDI